MQPDIYNVVLQFDSTILTSDMFQNNTGCLIVYKIVNYKYVLILNDKFVESGVYWCSDILFKTQ